METIRVNMTPCEDIKTIHASQNDNEAREWGFELHNNGDKIDSSSISDQLVFKAYEGGTEEILPTNGSTPTTSPFLGDIKYPQGLLSDQEFLYRESPTEEDGLAKITDIKGNTLVWNQLVKNGDFSASSGWTGQFATVTISNAVASVSQDRVGDYVALRKANLQGLTGHKYLVVADVKSAKKTAIAFYLSNTYSSAYDIQANTRTVVHAIITVSNANTGGFNVYTNRKTELAEGDVVEFYHVMLFDLTQMGLDISNPSEFTSLFPLPYYAYNQGTLLSFMGSGIKTVGKNLLDANIGIAYGGGSGMRWYESQGFMLMANKTYTFSASNTGGTSVTVYIIDHATRTALASSSLVTTYTPTQNAIIYLQAYRGAGIPSGTEFQLEIGTQTAYEPYTESDSSLPVSTYFPTGMKSAENASDELVPTKATVRIGEQTWNGSESFDVTNTRTNTIQFARGVSPSAKSVDANTVGNVISNFFLADSLNNVYSQDIEGIGIDTSGRIRVTILKSRLSSADVAGFKNWLASNNLTFYYELATPIETSFTTASLVTENSEIPLSNEDGVLIGKCTEQLSENPGFIDAKIKLADADGECYSNKIQLHVERKPS